MTTKVQIRFIFNSRILETLVKKFPVFKGHIPLLSWIIKLLPFNKEVSMGLGEATYKLDLKYPTHLSCIKLGKYEELESSVVSTFLSKGDIFLDIGANWGYFSVLSSNAVGLKGTVFSIEANPKTFAWLCKMLRTSCVSNVLPFNYAVCDRNDEKVIFASPVIASDAFGHILNNDKLLVRKDVVMTTTVDTLWERLGKPIFKMAKIDVEGMEPLVLKGGEKCFTEGVLECVLIEINDWTEERCGIAYKECFNLLFGYGFEYIYEPGLLGYRALDIKTTDLPCNKTFLFSRKSIVDSLMEVNI